MLISLGSSDDLQYMKDDSISNFGTIDHWWSLEVTYSLSVVSRFLWQWPPFTHRCDFIAFVNCSSRRGVAPKKTRDYKTARAMYHLQSFIHFISFPKHMNVPSESHDALLPSGLIASTYLYIMRGVSACAQSHRGMNKTTFTEDKNEATARKLQWWPFPMYLKSNRVCSSYRSQGWRNQKAISMGAFVPRFLLIVSNRLGGY